MSLDIHEQVVCVAQGQAAIWRRILNRIHEGGSIWKDSDRKAAYNVVARIASDHRTDILKRYGGDAYALEEAID